jgi:3-oxoadipate enol-lactonase
MTDGILFVHAFPLDGRMWDPQVSAFEAGLPVAAPHMPGFGGSPPAGDVMTMAAAAERCLAELDRTGIDRAVVCGLSMGGYVSLELWRRAPERFAGIVLANTRSQADSKDGAAARRALAERLRTEGSDFLVESPPPLLSDRAEPRVRELVRHMISEQLAGSIAAASLGMAERPDSTPDLAGIRVPALVITSDLDTLITREATEPLASQIPGARLAVIEGAGHLSNLEAPEEFNRLLEEHLGLCGVPG